MPPPTDTDTRPEAGDPNVEATLELLRAVAEHATGEEADIVAAALELLPQVTVGQSPQQAADRELRRALAD